MFVNKNLDIRKGSFDFIYYTLGRLDSNSEVPILTTDYFYYFLAPSASLFF